MVICWLKPRNQHIHCSIVLIKAKPPCVGVLYPYRTPHPVGDSAHKEQQWPLGTNHRRVSMVFCPSFTTIWDTTEKQQAGPNMTKFTILLYTYEYTVAVNTKVQTQKINRHNKEKNMFKSSNRLTTNTSSSSVETFLLKSEVSKVMCSWLAIQAIASCLKSCTCHNSGINYQRMKHMFWIWKVTQVHLLIICFPRLSFTKPHFITFIFVSIVPSEKEIHFWQPVDLFFAFCPFLA